ncbi:MAG: S8 family serine peptidase [Gemmatimonadetes bacterium]|nr:S8 family serine peptidase [Gemmatimonadota bacterium]
MNRPSQILRLASLLIALAATALPGQGGARRVIITLRSSSGEAALRAPGSPPVTSTELSQISARLDRDLPTLVETGRAPFAGMLFAQVSAAEATRLASDPNVAMVEEDRLWSPADAVTALSSGDRWAALRSQPTDGADTTPWGVARVMAPEVWANGNRGAGVKVAVMDSGIDTGHSDLSVAGGYNAVTRVASGYGDDIGACNGHGTHIAGTIAALSNGSGVVGVAPDVQLYAIKVFQDVSGSCLAYTSNQIAGLNWAVSQGIRLVNVSIGGSSSFSYNAAIATAADQGTFLIAAAGNGGGAVLYPAAAPSAIAVAALDDSNLRASWSSFGPEVGFAAPGVNINSTMPGGGYGGKSGTSMAAPHVVGVAALILAAHPGLTLDGLRQKLRDGVLDVDAGGFDNNTGFGLVRAQPSLGGGSPPPPVPLAMSVSPLFRSTTATAGMAATGSSASVSLSGDNAGTTAWNATKRKNWTTLTTASGSGSGTVAWNRSTAGLTAGTYVDTITVSAAGVASQSIIDTLRITAAPVPLTMAVAPLFRSTVATAGTAAAGSSATITLSGDNAGTTAWTAAKRKSWTTLTTASGTGSGTVAWSRSTAGLVAGTYVDTITVSASGVAAQNIIDTLRITAAPVPLALAVSPLSRNATAQVGTAAPGDNATVTLTGDNAGTTPWTTSKRKSWTTLTTGSGTGSGTASWTRSTAGLSAGTYVDTITVTVAGLAPQSVIDTLRITAAPVALALAVSPRSRNTMAQVGTAASGDNAAVTLTGDNAGGTAWTAAKRKSWTTLTTSSGTGTGTAAWTRSTAGLTAGTYVDTITVTVAGLAPQSVIDTLHITAAPVPLALAVSPSSRNASAQVGTAAPGDNAGVTLTGDNAGTTAWTVAKRKSWTTLTTNSGTGNGTAAWTRSTAGLTAGTYVDTITVTVVGLAPQSVIDTLRITAAPVALALAVTPSSRNVATQVGTEAPSDNAAVSLTGDNAGTTAWTAAKRKSWTTITTGSGTGTGTAAWTRSTAGLTAGTYVDTITVTVAGLAPQRVIDTLRITAAPVALTLAVAPGSRSTTAAAGAPASGDNAAVTLSGDNAGATPWTATKRKSWTTLTTAGGIGSGSVVWTRNTAGLSAGTYVDTITVAASGLSPQRVIDTLRITSAPVPVTVAVSPGGRRVTVTRGNNAASATASVTLVGTDAGSTAWLATRRRSQTSFTTSSGVGSGTVAWNRNTSALTAGTYVDTITVTAGAATARLIDTVVVTTPTTATILLLPKGKKSRYLTQAGRANAFASTRDSALVEGEVVEGQSDQWTAVIGGTGLTVLSPVGRLGEYVYWERRSAASNAGLYVDTVRVQLVGSAGLEATFVDSLEVVTVEVPAVGLAVDELVRGGQLNNDQRLLFDSEGNRNGYFDLGDFLAWVDRDRIRLSPSQVAKLQSIPITPVRPRS